MKFYFPATEAIHATDIFQYILKKFSLPTTTTEDYICQSVVNIIPILQSPSIAQIVLPYRDSAKNAVNQVAHFLHCSTQQPCLKILTFPPMLPPTPSKPASLAI